jgi:ectoine hydroxylase-related dioxygenase (phytanoyl-CoA dioxygenase family)
MHISFKDSPKQALALYEQDGYFVEPSVFSPSECAELINAGMKLPGILAGDYRPAMHPHRQNSVFLDAMRDRRIVDTMQLLVGGKPSGLQTEFFYGKPGVKGFARHQDNFFVEAPGNAFASAWIALVDVGPDNGGLVGYPASHKEGRLPVRQLNVGNIPGQDPNANNEETILSAEYSEVDLVVPRGSIAYLHSYFVHGSHPNKTNDLRFALLCTYIREGASFRPGRYAQREAVAI